MYSKKAFTFFFTTILFAGLLYGFGAKAVAVGDFVNFQVDEEFEKDANSQVQAVLIKTSPNLYFYIEKKWWDAQVLAKQDEILTNLNSLSLEFDNNIYPTLTSVFGTEWKPGVDGDNKITILLHSMKEGIGGYFRSTDEYLKLQVPNSNEKEMIYLPISQIENNYKLKIFLAHEFVHLITFNQKDRILGVSEEVWLNEARAEYAITVLGYNNSYIGSNLQLRVKDFLEKPSDSVVEWQNGKYDYAVINLFMNYLVDHYGINILQDSLKSKLVGIPSINEVLQKNGYQEDFAQIFTEWTITLIVNDCQINLKYCYLNNSLDNLKINPTLIFLPISGDSSLSVTNVTKNWSGNWQKIIGGSGDLKLKFSSLLGLDFKVPYIIFDKSNNYTINFLNLDKNQEGEINIEDFGSKYNSLIIIPSLQTKISKFNGFESTYPYTFIVSITGAVQDSDQALIQSLLDQIDSLKKQIAAILASNGTSRNDDISCTALNNNLYFGISNSSAVTCLQQFLKTQGQDIYPEGLVTGVFGNLTKSAVIRFQEKYYVQILIPLGLTKGTGFVGSSTRLRINQLNSCKINEECF
ncbi:MAG: hypothetical protein A3D34_01320 [Candidatus Staskawiczbacteria bacterium RIFCSPHIGHO2_02_FULL_33_16]|uniref:Peptidoglycan binding-like domain-containing protein n=1 Tax=Candidatus Staskawiczbacteria bacterium RIFCSPHIGHO2_02_FULL_33_16 TaxID=1802204 RepID=A0A1G2HX13_9BACT|nr:MAG: hypothetical protein A3D34_01320 [Candidatus Staskawiczbacteria bacterium RIFCSPHIGHO2_02_FULL_33_16]OGZ71078.1 MAG: hypothetical protein A2980_03490 [Candidatus Staskawiczbacteria bacterium RIFCSPLOWO2_01_FULL_33_13]